MPSNGIKIGLHLKVRSSRKSSHPIPDPDLESIDPEDDDYFFMNWLVAVIAVGLTLISHFVGILWARSIGFNETIYVSLTALVGLVIFFLGTAFLRILVFERVVIGLSIILASLVGWISAPVVVRVNPIYLMSGFLWFVFWGFVMAIFVITPALIYGRKAINYLQDLRESYGK